MPRRFAIAIGVNRYDFLPNSRLSYAERDALAMRDLFQNKLSFEQSYCLRDPEDDREDLPMRPTRSNLLRCINRVAQEVRLATEDSFWFFFSGHGARQATYDYLLPLDADPDNVEETAISTDYVMRKLQSCGAGQVVMILDACRNVIGTGGKTVGGVGRDTENRARQQGIISLFSCAPEQISWELEALKQGAFTQALLEKLGDSQSRAGLTVQSLDEFLRQRVPDLNRQYGKPVQDPYVIAEPSWRYLQPILPGSSAPESPENPPAPDIQSLKVQASDAFHDGDWDRAKDLYQKIVQDATDPQDRLRAVRAIETIILRQPQAIPPTATPKDISPPPQRPPQVPPQYRQDPNPSFRPIILQLSSQTGKVVMPLELLPIPRGTFWMGQTQAETQQLKKEGEETYQQFFARELPRHQVTIPPFWMGRYPVTQAQYEAVMGNNPTLGKAWVYDGTEWKPDQQIPEKFLGDEKPVVGVSWHEAVEFCRKLTQSYLQEELRDGEILLPTEAQWEYACRAGTETAFYGGDRLEPDQANYGCSISYNGSKTGEWQQVTTSVGSFPANAWGLQDMHGNVWEWCLDQFYDSYQRKPEALKQDGSNPWTKEFSGISPSSDTRLLRGGSWDSYAESCRSACRDHSAPVNRYFSFGFRVVCRASRTR